jgi:hypothetical protein
VTGCVPSVGWTGGLREAGEGLREPGEAMDNIRSTTAVMNVMATGIAPERDRLPFAFIRHARPPGTGTGTVCPSLLPCFLPTVSPSLLPCFLADEGEEEGPHYAEGSAEDAEDGHGRLDSLPREGPDGLKRAGAAAAADTGPTLVNSGH